MCLSFRSTTSCGIEMNLIRSRRDVVFVSFKTTTKNLASRTKFARHAVLKAVLPVVYLIVCAYVDSLTPGESLFS